MRKLSELGVFSGLYFPVFGLNTEIFRINIHIQAKYGNIETWKMSRSDTFHAVTIKHYSSIPVGIYLLKVNNRNTRTRCKIYSKLKNKDPRTTPLLNYANRNFDAPHLRSHKRTPIKMLHLNSQAKQMNCRNCKWPVSAC